MVTLLRRRLALLSPTTIFRCCPASRRRAPQRHQAHLELPFGAHSSPPPPPPSCLRSPASDAAPPPPSRQIAAVQLSTTTLRLMCTVEVATAVVGAAASCRRLIRCSSRSLLLTRTSPLCEKETCGVNEGVTQRTTVILAFSLQFCQIEIAILKTRSRQAIVCAFHSQSDIG
jgi:hypothetical protein